MISTLLGRRLQHFLAIFETGNINHAAEQIGLSQPALSMSLRQLEEDVGAVLFKRQARGVVPTDAGEVLYRYASSMRQAARLAGEEIAALGSGQLNRLRLGAGVAWTTSVLPGVLIDLQARFPKMSIDMVTGVGDQLAGLLLSGEIDVFLAAGSMPSLDAPDIAREFIANLPMLAVADKDHPLARQMNVSAADLVGTSWAGFYEDEGFFHLARHYMALRGLPAPKIAMRTNSAAALTTLVRASEMVTILISPLARSACQTGLTALNLAEPLWEMPAHIYYRELAGDLEAVKTFREQVSKKVASIA